MDPSPSLLASIYAATPVPRNMPLPERPPGPPPVDFLSVAAPVFQQAQQLADPIAAQIVALIRGAAAGAPDALAQLAAAAPGIASTAFGLASAGTGTGALVASLSGPAAALLAGPAAAIPWGVGAPASAALGVWSGVAPGVAAGLGAASAGFQALATGGQLPMPNFQQWGQLTPQVPA